MEDEEEDVEELAETPREGEEGGGAPPLSSAASESLVEDEREAEGHTGKEQEQVGPCGPSFHPESFLVFCSPSLCLCLFISSFSLSETPSWLTILFLFVSHLFPVPEHLYVSFSPPFSLCILEAQRKMRWGERTPTAASHSRPCISLVLPLAVCVYAWFVCVCICLCVCTKEMGTEGSEERDVRGGRERETDTPTERERTVNLLFAGVSSICIACIWMIRFSIVFLGYKKCGLPFLLPACLIIPLSLVCQTCVCIARVQIARPKANVQHLTMTSLLVASFC